MKYAVSFFQGKDGNSVAEGSTLDIKIDGAYFFSGGIYKNGFPVIAFQTIPGDNTMEVVVKRKGISLKGKATLKIKAFDEKWRGSGWSDDFIIT